MLAIVIYVVAALAVVVIGLVTVGRETFAAAQVPRPAVYEIDAAARFVADRLDDRTAARLTPADVLWLLTIDAAQLADTDTDPGAPGTIVVDDTEAVQRVMERLDAQRRAFIDADVVAAVIAARTDYLVMIGAIGSRAEHVDAERAGPEADPGAASGPV